MQEDSTDKILQELTKEPLGKPRRRSGAVIAIGAIALVLIALFGVGLVPRLHANKAIAEIAKENSLPVNVIPAARGKATTELTLPSTLLPVTEATIYARTNGYVKRWYVDIGTNVKAGQLLAEIETPEVDRELKQASATMGQVKANLDLAKTTAERWQVLLKDRAVSQQEVDEKVGGLAAQQADLAAAEANVQRLQELKQFQRVVAPFEGTVTARNVDVGQLITAGSNNASSWLFKVSKTGTLRLYVNVPQTHVRLMQAGLPADVVLREYPGKPFPGKVLRTAGALDTQSKTLLVEVQVPNDHGELLAGMYANVRFKLNQAQPVIVLPANTLIMRTDGPQVAAVQNNTVHMRKIVLGRDFGQQFEVISGLQENEQIVTNPPDGMREGAQVKVVQPAAAEKK